MVAAFDIADVNANPARFDPKKCESINATHIRMLAPDDFAARLTSFVQSVGLPAEPALLAAAAPLVQERIRTLGEGAEMLRFLLAPDEQFQVDEAAAAKQLGEAGQAVVAAALSALEALDDWSTQTLEPTLESALVDGLGLKPRNAYGPLRVAITGRTVSPPLFESMELLGRERSLRRLHAAGRAPH
jgi:glutamyl-tRNA synthetase